MSESRCTKAEHVLTQVNTMSLILLKIHTGTNALKDVVIMYIEDCA